MKCRRQVLVIELTIAAGWPPRSLPTNNVSLNRCRQ